MFAVNGDRCKGVRGKSMDVRERGREWCGYVVQVGRCGICEWCTAGSGAAMLGMADEVESEVESRKFLPSQGVLDCKPG